MQLAVLRFVDKICEVESVRVQRRTYYNENWFDCEGCL